MFSHTDVPVLGIATAIAIFVFSFVIKAIFSHIDESQKFKDRKLLKPIVFSVGFSLMIYFTYLILSVLVVGKEQFNEVEAGYERVKEESASTKGELEGTKKELEDAKGKLIRTKHADAKRYMVKMYQLAENEIRSVAGGVEDEWEWPQSELITDSAKRVLGEKRCYAAILGQRDIIDKALTVIITNIGSCIIVFGDVIVERELKKVRAKIEQASDELGAMLSAMPQTIAEQHALKHRVNKRLLGLADELKGQRAICHEKLRELTN